MDRITFESTALEIANSIATVSEASFYAGTLFVKCNAYAAAKIKEALVAELPAAVKISKVGPEYAFDFV